jgi:hypothetical protein
MADISDRTESVVGVGDQVGESIGPPRSDDNMSTVLQGPHGECSADPR